jgi:hydroxyacylglutathione hydrolase
MTQSQHDWFTVRPVANQVWAVDDHGEDTMYLVEGQERALLIDTGFGVGDLPKLIASVTSLPLDIVNTHGHPDHVGGNYQFQSVYITDDDLPLLQGCFTKVDRQWMLENALKGPFPSDFSPEKWVNAERSDIISIKPGDIFDLGGRELKVIPIPGHTPGSIGLLDEGERLLFSGDSIQEGDIWMHLPESLPLTDFLRCLKKVDLLSDKFDQILPGHGRTPLPTRVLIEFIEGISKIVSGEFQGTPCRTMVGDGVLCRFNLCGVVYNQNRI